MASADEHGERGERDRAQASGTPAIVALSAVLAAAAVALVALVVVTLPDTASSLDLPWWALAPLFTVSERLAVHLRVGRSAFTVSFGHVPLVLGMCLLAPLDLVLASVVGSALTLLVHRRQRGLKLAFNLALWALESALVASIYGVLAGGAEPASARSMLAALVTIVVTDQVTALAVTAVIALHERAVDLADMREALTWGLLVAMCNTSAALLVVVLVERSPAALPLLLVVLGVLVVAYRSYEQLRDVHARLERHHAVAESLAAAQGTTAVVAAVLTQARDMLEAEHAELHLEGDVHTTGARVGGGRPGGATSPEDPEAAGPWLRRVGTGAGGGAVLPRGTKDPHERSVLAALGAQEAAAAPVHAGSTTGVLVVTDHLGEVAPFSPGDLRALETLAHQAGVALENGRLVDRLRQEAADRAHEALHDPLTGLPNRRHFSETLDAALAAGAAAGVVMLDLDRFQDVNDALGHTVGDEVLEVVAQRLRAALPDHLVVARLGGDEFAVMVPDAGSPEVIVDTSVAVQRALAEPVRVRGIELGVEASIGSATAPADARDGEGLLQRADVAMYRAKEQRTGYEPYLSSLDRSSSERLAVYADLRRAVTAEQLEVAYQPAVDPRTGRVVSAEALVRWDHPERGPVPPDEFVPLAERSGLITPLTLQVLRRAVGDLARWTPLGLLPRVAVNLAPRVLLDASLPALVERMLDEVGLPAHALTLEVTESAVMHDPERAVAVLEALHAMDVHLSVDDFGTGYSSLSYLKRLPVHEVKIDRSFVAPLATAGSAAADAAIVRSTIDLAHALGLTVVAEGVEDAETLGLLGLWGCDSVQGFFVSRPKTAPQIEPWLAARCGGGLRAAPPAPRTPPVLTRLAP